MKLSTAIKNVLAYIHVTGRFPAGIHLSTLAKVHHTMIDGEPGRNTVKPEYFEYIKNHTFIRGRDYLVNERGFESKPKFHSIYERNTSREICFLHIDGGEGYIHRAGGGWIWSKNGRGGMNTEQLDGKF